MILATVATLALVQSPNLPENPSVDYSGIPSVSATNISVTSHAVTVEIFDKYALVSSTTLVKNNGAAGNARFTIPRLRLGDANSGAPNLPITATWANKAVTLASPKLSMKTGSGKYTVYSSPLSGAGPMLKGGSYALRISYQVPIGKCGFDQKMHLAAYDLSTTSSIGVVNCTYRYGKGLVFRLPEAKPDLGWQVGEKGVFLREQNYTGASGLTWVQFYPGGFGNIGG